VSHNSGITHVGLEIESNQQSKIDQFMHTGAGLNDIQINSQIDCLEFRNLFNVLMGHDQGKRPVPIALDFSKSKYGGTISRDEWMAKSIAGVFESNPNAKMLVIVGNNHVLKKLDWQDQVVNKHKSIREYLSDKRRKLRIFSIGQVIGESVYKDDFRKQFGPIEGAVAMGFAGRVSALSMFLRNKQTVPPLTVGVTGEWGTGKSSFLNIVTSDLRRYGIN
jgi:hypothetical protein